MGALNFGITPVAAMLGRHQILIGPGRVRIRHHDVGFNPLAIGQPHPIGRAVPDQDLFDFGIAADLAALPAADLDRLLLLVDSLIDHEQLPWRRRGRVVDVTIPRLGRRQHVHLSVVGDAYRFSSTIVDVRVVARSAKARAELARRLWVRNGLKSVIGFAFDGEEDVVGLSTSRRQPCIPLSFDFTSRRSRPSATGSSSSLLAGTRPEASGEMGIELSQCEPAAPAREVQYRYSRQSRV